MLTTCAGWALYHGLERPNVERTSHWLSNTNVLMLYLLAVMWSATRYGKGPAIVASVLGVAAFDFCFVPPYLTFVVRDTPYIPIFAVMLLTAVVISTLADQARRQAQLATDRERRTAAMFELSRQLAASAGIDEIVALTLQQIGEVFQADAAILLPQGDRLTVRSYRGRDVFQSPEELAAAQWAYEHGQRAGAGIRNFNGARAVHLPLPGSQVAVGVLSLSPSSASDFAEPDQSQLLESFANQAASAIERAMLAEQARQAWERVEAEFMRNTLLSSVSHDLRTPLAVITGTASSLADNPPADPMQRRLLAQTILQESESMERVISNLLDMTRLESGGLTVFKEWQPIQEVIGAALHHLSKRLGDRPITLQLPPDLPMVPIDAVAIEQVLVNLLDNAAEYTPAGSPIQISARNQRDELVVEVRDHGPGLPQGTQARVFQKFFRASATQGRRGIGLGLAICKGLVEAHGGRILAANGPGGGAIFTFTLPIEGVPPVVNSEG